MFDDMLLQMDNARLHIAVITQQYLAAMGIRLVYQSQYSPDLNLYDRFLFKRLKEVVRLVQYDSNDEVVKAAQHCLRAPICLRSASDQEWTTLHADIVDFMYFHVTRYFIVYYHSF